MESSEVILQIGGEGGDLTIYGVRTETGWRFSREVIDQNCLMLDGTETCHSSEVVDTWDGALALLDRYRWHYLFPLAVHPEFRQQVIDLVRARYEAGSVPDRYGQLDRWNKVCSADPDAYLD